MNLLLTERCNKNCSFCLIPGRRNSDSTMSFQDYLHCLDIAVASAERTITLLGGEPTLHPDFAKMVESACQRGLSIILLTNLLCQDVMISRLHHWSSNNVIEEFLVNADFPDTYSPSSYARFSSNLARVSACPTRVTLAITVSDVRPFSDYDYLIRYYQECDITRVRIALDVRTLWAQIGNRQIGSHYYSVARLLCEQGFAVSAELCAMPRCIFTDYEHRYLSAHCAGYHGLIGCEPNLDVFPDLTVSYCAARPRNGILARPLTFFQSWEHARAYFRGLRDELHLQPVETCGGCADLLRNQCRIGCLARFDDIALPSSNDERSFRRIPDGIAILPLMDRWHIFFMRKGRPSESYVLDTIAMDLIETLWCGGTRDALVRQLLDRFEVGWDQAARDTDALLDRLGDLARVK